MPQDLMRYDLLAQEALRGVVRHALKKVERSGLPGDHHFYIAFNTQHPGVRISDRLRDRFPSEMTIVIQHQFWNLAVRDDEFEVELSFKDIPEKLVIPFSAIKGFLDPSVEFGLQFETVAAGSSEPPVEVKPPSAAVELPAEEAPAEDQPKIVSLDSFRRK